MNATTLSPSLRRGLTSYVIVDVVQTEVSATIRVSNRDGRSETVVCFRPDNASPWRFAGPRNPFKDAAVAYLEY